MREPLFAALIAFAALTVVVGVSKFSEGAAWIVAGVLMAGWSWLVFGEIG